MDYNRQKGMSIMISHAPHIAVAVILLAVVIYLPTLGGDFFSDDNTYIVNNKVLQELPLIEGWRVFSERTNPVEYLPLRDLSYKLDMSVYGLQAWGFHLSNIVLYLLVCLSVWFCTGNVLKLIGYGPDGTRDFALITASVACIFALHPAHVESVAWISGRKEILSGLFAFISIGLFAASRRDGVWSRSHLALSCLFFSFALFSKSTVITLPFFLLVAASAPISSVIMSRSRISGYAAAMLPFILIAIAFFILNLEVGAETKIRLNDYQGLSRGTDFMSRAVIVPLTILGHLTRILFVPFNQRLVYEVPFSGHEAWSAAILGLIAMAGAAAGVIKLLRSKSLPGTGIFTVVVFCLPFLQIVPFTTWSMASERFVFIPVFGAAVLITGLIRKVRHGYTILLPIILIICLSVSVQRVLQWKSPADLWRSNIRYAPNNITVLYNYINEVLLPEGRFDEAWSHSDNIARPDMKTLVRSYINVRRAIRDGDREKMRESRDLLASLVDIDTQFSGFPVLGKLYENDGDYINAARYYYYAVLHADESSIVKLQGIRERYRDAISAHKTLIGDNPGDLNSRAELAGLYTELFMLPEARQQYRELLGMVSGRSRAIVHYNIGLTYMRSMSYEQAIIEIERALEGGFINENVFNNAGVAYRNLGVFTKAEELFLKAAAVNESYTDSLSNLGIMKLNLGEKASALDAFREGRRRMLMKGQTTELFDKWISLALED